MNLLKFNTEKTTIKNCLEKAIKGLVIMSLLVFGFAKQLSAQENVTLNGYMRDASNGEELIGSTVYITELQTGTASNYYGFYSIT
ncbi:MAG: hypothetical protein JXQ90_24145, partial [Cyclobacteriaceae bacterium]